METSQEDLQNPFAFAPLEVSVCSVVYFLIHIPIAHLFVDFSEGLKAKDSFIPGLPAWTDPVVRGCLLLVTLCGGLDSQAPNRAHQKLHEKLLCSQQDLGEGSVKEKATSEQSLKVQKEESLGERRQDVRVSLGSQTRLILDMGLL